MSVPVSQMWAVARYVLTQVVRGRKRYPLVLMLEPLLRCNLACAGCGKVQYPGDVLRREMAVEDALAAAEACGTPVVSIAGGEPLMHAGIEEIVEGLIRQGRYVYLCTNGILLRNQLEEGRFTPTKYLTFNVHMDGDREAHDFAVCREGVYDQAEDAIRAAVSRGFRVTTNTTLFGHADSERVRSFFDRMMGLGVESMTISPGYSYEKAPSQDDFLSRQRTWALFRGLFERAKPSWRFNHSPLFLEYLMGRRHFECTPWGNPCYTLFGWQRPCYLLQEGYARTLSELLEDTDWDAYGRASGNPKCQQCMVHCGHEPTAVHHTFTSPRGFAATARATLAPLDSRRGGDIELPPVTRAAVTGAEAVAPGSVEHDLAGGVDFRGAATLHLADSSSVEGYVFDASSEQVRLLVAGRDEPLELPSESVLRVERTGRDYAEGRSWEAWVRKHDERKARDAAEPSTPS